MSLVSLIIGVVGYASGGLLLIRGTREKLLSRFPFFYSYLTFAIGGSALAYLISIILPALYARLLWWHFFVTVLAEFAVIVEISDHLFEPYPAIRGLGRLLVAFVSVILFLLYVVPSLGGYPSSRASVLGFVKKASVLKVVGLLAVLAVARRYRLRLGRNLSGMTLGFCVYLGIGLANFAVAETDEARVYEGTFSLIAPLSFTLALMIWMVGLWSYQPASQLVEQLRTAEGVRPGALGYELDRMNNALTRLLRG